VLYVHRSERADMLATMLADLLADPLDDPMVPEIVVVPTRGVERWISQVLATRLGAGPGGGDGVCANVAFEFPGALVRRITAAVCGIEEPERDPWAPERSVWPLLALVDQHRDEPFLAPLRRHLEAATPEGEPLRRFPALRRLADLYDRYAVNRPELLEAWGRGQAVWGDGGDGTEAWQAELWRRLRARIGVPGPAERAAEAVERLVADPKAVDLPPRLSLFGLTRLAASHLRVLDALATARDVHLFLLHPSPALWETVAAALPRPVLPLRRVEDPTGGLARHPLLRSWGRDAREMELVLLAQGVDASDHRPVGVGNQHPQGGEPTTLLARIQADIRADRTPGAPHRPAGRDASVAVPGEEDPRPLLAPNDDSVRVHACYGRARQVEVLRDALLHLLAADPSLEPRDVLVMCPDIEAFAPHVEAAFGSANQATDGAAQTGGLPQIRVRLADRSLRQTNPLLAVAAHLLELAAGRVTASEVLDLAAREPVARRFGFDDDDLARIGTWTAETGIRWGLDAADRERWQLQGEPVNTWRFGLDRLLLGTAMDAEALATVGGSLPYDDVSSGDIDLVGRFAEFVGRLGVVIDALRGRKPVAAWTAALAAATEALAQAAPHDSWQHDQLRSVLDDVADEAACGPSTVELDLAEITSLLDGRLQGRPSRANFRTGDLTVCTLVPMRSVPHRVVALLGLDDGSFPRPGPADGDNLLLADPLVGERDPRAEDRQLLLDAVLAATEHLIVTYEGHDARTNAVRPPAVPVAELLDVVDRTVRVAEPGVLPRQLVVVEHPLQSFDPRNFIPGALGTAGPFGFDPADLAGAQAVRQPPAPRSCFLDRPLPLAPAPVVALESLVRFVQHPVQTFLRERLALSSAADPDVVDDDIPVTLDPLERWAVGDRLLAACLAGVPLEVACAAERARGLVPPGRLADTVLDDLARDVEELLRALGEAGCAAASAVSVPVHVVLPDGRRLEGAVPGVRGDAVVHATYAKLGYKHRLGSWVRLLALAASDPARTWRAVTIGRSPADNRQRGDTRRTATSVLRLPKGTDTAAPALNLLAAVVDLYDQGLREPLPLYCKTSGTYAESRRDGKDPSEALQQAEQRWQSGSKDVGEAVDPAHVLVLGGVVPLSHVMGQAAAGAGDGGGAGAEPTRFGRLAVQLWGPLLEHETLSIR